MSMSSLAEVLKLKDRKRIVFNEITKDALESASPFSLVVLLLGSREAIQ